MPRHGNTRGQLTISIVSHGHGGLLGRLLRDLDREASLAGVEVVLTLNLKDEITDVSPFPNLRFVVIRNDVPKGFGANHNQAFSRCSTPWFAVLNPDLRVSGKEPFSTLIEAAQEIDRLGVIAPVVVNDAGQLEDSVRGNLTPWSLFRRHVFRRRATISVAGVASEGHPFYWLAGMCLLFDSSAYAAIGGFDSRFFLYGEDYDICARIYGHGMAVALEPRCRIVHSAQRDSHRSLRHLRWHIASLLRIWSSAAFWRVTLARRRHPPDNAIR